MNVLLLHNNNIPLGFRIDFNVDNDVYSSQLLTYKLYDKEDKDTLKDYDTFICDKLSDYFKEKKYDLIILPFSMGEDNYPEYSGLRIATHIRLTPEWKHYATPILFIGPDTKDDVLHFSDLGDILYTYQVFTSNARTKEDLAKQIAKININADCTVPPYNEWLETTSYEQFLERIRVTPPANYATHHSIANKWAVLRWIEMFSWDVDAPRFFDEGFKNMLYFKKLIAKAGVRESYKNKNKKRDPKITWNDVGTFDKSRGTRNRKRLVYIDDEESMWGCVLSPIFQKSDIDYIPYHFDRQNKISKRDLIQNIKSFLKQDYDINGGADCYLIDLRLHDDDFAKKIKSEDLSGQQIAKYIKKKIINENGEKEGLNEGCQIVIFTASNKSWNIEASMIRTGACGYVIKEPPEMNYTRDESYDLFWDFSQKIKTAFKMSYLQELYRTLDYYQAKLRNKIDISSLYEYADLQNLDQGEKRNSIIKACALQQYVFLEVLMDEVLGFKVEASGQITKKGSSVGKTSHRIIYETKTENGYTIIDNILYHPENTTNTVSPLLSNQKYLEDRLPGPLNNNKEKPFDYMIAALLVYYGIDVTYVRKTIDLGRERNTAIAHGNKTVTITLEDLQVHFEKVILPILKKESEE